MFHEIKIECQVYLLRCVDTVRRHQDTEESQILKTPQKLKNSLRLDGHIPTLFPFMSEWIILMTCDVLCAVCAAVTTFLCL